MGNDFYEHNEQMIVPGGGARPSGEVFGWATITRQYYDRYRRPVMHTETNTMDADRAPRWLWKEFFNVLDLRRQGVPVLGFTWYSLLDQVDWDSALTQDRGVVNPLGLFDLQRRPRPVAAAYREMLLQFGSEPLVPNSTVLTFTHKSSDQGLNGGEEKSILGKGHDPGTLPDAAEMLSAHTAS